MGKHARLASPRLEGALNVRTLNSADGWRALSRALAPALYITNG